MRKVIVDSRTNKTNPPKLLESNSCTVGDINSCVGSLLSMDQCKLLDNESGWVSDNLHAFARVIKWYYYTITTLQPEKKNTEPLTAVEVWTKTMCKEWLKSHGLTTDGKVSERREVIVDSRTNKTNLPNLLKCNSCTVGDINSCVGSLLSMVSHIMSRFVSIKTPLIRWTGKSNCFQKVFIMLI